MKGNDMGRHKGFTVEDYQRLAHAGLTMAEAAAEMGITRQSVWVMARRHGIVFAAAKGKPDAGTVPEEKAARP